MPRDDDDKQGRGGAAGGGIQHISRLTVQGITYEGVISGNDANVKVSDGDRPEAATELSKEDVDNVVEFFSSFQREQRRMTGEGGRGRGRRRGGDNPTGRGEVRNPETDGRLRGNESQRPNDPDRSKQAEGGAKGGSAPRER